MTKSLLTLAGDRVPARLFETKDVAGWEPAGGEWKIYLPPEYEYKRPFSRAYFHSGNNRYSDYAKIIVQDLAKKPISPPEVSGLAVSFSRLSSEADIAAFASQYGLLDLNLFHAHSSVEGSIIGKIVGYLPGKVIDAEGNRLRFEPLSLWEREIQNVRYLMHLYTWLRDGDTDVSKAPGLTLFDSVDNGPFSDYQERGAGWLAFSILRYMEGKIDVNFSGVLPDSKTSINFRIIETKTTTNLLAAICYDLWEMITRQEAIYVCEYCGLPIDKKKRQKFCNNSCKQADYRLRQKAKNNEG